MEKSDFKRKAEAFLKCNLGLSEIEMPGALDCLLGAGWRDGLWTEEDEPFYLAWPTEHAVITQAFGVNASYYKQFGFPGGHEGVDFKAPMGSKIFACAPGVVTKILNELDPVRPHPYGKHVRILHVSGYETVYAHLKEIVVFKGQQVARGQVIGLANNTGNSRGSHLHLTLVKKGATAEGILSKGIKWPRDVVDPTPFLRKP